MLISFNWLKKYVTLPDSILPEEVAVKLKAATVEVEAIVKPGESLAGIVVGKIKTVEKHANADKLKVCRVNVGNEEVVIVCGGSNVAEGMLVAVAKLGAKVRWHGEGEPIVMEKATIRGVESFGMICAADEIGLAERFPKKEEREVVDLSQLKVKPGTLLSAALGMDDVLFEIDNKSLSHRPDLWGHYGIAREVAVLFNREVAPYPSEKIKPGKGMSIKVEVENKNDCPRYSAVAVDGLSPSESPEWLKNALKAVGVRPINSIVDATNYIMFDVGQPLHAFDAAVLDKNTTSKNNKHIFVRRAKQGEKLVTLDTVERALDEQVLVIADSEQPLALAGVMGGLESGISAATTTVIIESATFAPGLIRAASGRYALRSDASMRFEKNLDPNVCSRALERVVSLLLELHPTAKVVSGVVDHYESVRKPQTLEMPLSFFAQKIGTAIPEKFITQTLVRLGFGVKQKKNTVVLSVPTWRGGKDIALPEDVVEEVLRLYGYENIIAALPEFTIDPVVPSALKKLERELTDMLVQNLKYTEVYTYSFVSEAQIVKLGDDPKVYLELDNPISKERPFIRRTLLPNLLEVLEKNSAERDRLALFEIGLVFRAEEAGLRSGAKSDELLPRQDTWLTAVYTEKKDRTPFWEAKRVAELFLEHTGLEVASSEPEVDSLSAWQHPARSLDLKHEGVLIGQVYELHPAVSERAGLGRVGVCALNLSAVSLLKPTARAGYMPSAVYPEVVRDLALVVPKSLSHETIVAALITADPLITKAALFDVFMGGALPEGTKSVAYHITYAHPDRTLTSAEVDGAEKKIIELVQKKLQAEIRV